MSSEVDKNFISDEQYQTKNYGLVRFGSYIANGRTVLFYRLDSEPKNGTEITIEEFESEINSSSNEVE